jgi:hypothetical protein
MKQHTGAERAVVDRDPDAFTEVDALPIGFVEQRIQNEDFDRARGRKHPLAEQRHARAGSQVFCRDPGVAGKSVAQRRERLL